VYWATAEKVGHPEGNSKDGGKRNYNRHDYIRHGETTHSPTWRTDAINVLAGPPKSPMAGLICIGHPGSKPSISANPSHRSLLFLLQGWLHWFPGLFTDTSEIIRFLLFSFFSVNSFFLILRRCTCYVNGTRKSSKQPATAILYTSLYSPECFFFQMAYGMFCLDQ